MLNVPFDMSSVGCLMSRKCKVKIFLSHSFDTLTAHERNHKKFNLQIKTKNYFH